MTLREHLISAVPLSLGVGLATGSTAAGVAAGLSAFLVDVDHVLDYVLSNGRFRSLGHMFDYCYGGMVRRNYLIFHAYELWLLGLFILPGLIGPQLALGVLSGWLLHLLLDQLFNPAHPLTYFLLYRLGVGFARERIKTPHRNLYSDLALRLGLPRPVWTRPRSKAER